MKHNIPIHPICKQLTLTRVSGKVEPIQVSTQSQQLVSKFVCCVLQRPNLMAISRHFRRSVQIHVAFESRLQIWPLFPWRWALSKGCSGAPHCWPIASSTCPTFFENYNVPSLVSYLYDRPSGLLMWSLGAIKCPPAAAMLVTPDLWGIGRAHMETYLIIPRWNKEALVFACRMTSEDTFTSPHLDWVETQQIPQDKS